MDETSYHRISEEYINMIAQRLEAADASGALEVEYAHGVLTIDMPSGKALLLSKHVASRQLWLSSPISGGLHFSHGANGWSLADGRALGEVLAGELKQLAGVDLEL